MRVFIYEYATAQADVSALPPSVRTEGRAMLRAISEDFSQIPGVEVLTLSGQTSANEEAPFGKLAQAADWSLIVAPEFGGILFDRCRWAEKVGGRLLGPPSEVVGLTADKWATYQFFRRHGVPTPVSWLASEAPPVAALSARGAWVQKPRWGAGSQEVRLLIRPSEAERSPDWLMQVHVPGVAASVAVLTGIGRVVPLLPGFQDVSEDGHFTYHGGRLPLSLHLAVRARALAVRAVESLPNLRGYLGVDLVLGPSKAEDCVIEINPRLTTSYVGLRALAEGNLAQDMLAIATAQSEAEPSWKPGGVTFLADGTVLATS